MKRFMSLGLVVVMMFMMAACAMPKLSPKGADLVIKELKVVAEGALVEGAKFELQFTIQNIGADPVGEITTPSKLLVPRIVVYNGSNLFAVSQVIPALKAGEEMVLSSETLNKDTLAGQAANLSIAKAGDYTLTATLDPVNFIAEITKDNNQTTLAITVAPKPAEEKK